MLNTIVLQVLVVLMASIRIRKYPTVTIQIKFTKLFSIIHVSWSSLDDLEYQFYKIIICATDNPTSQTAF